jgi:hypothetical protein
MSDFTVSDIVASLRETESNLRSMLHEKEAENQRLRGLLAELLEFRKRDDRGDPDYMPSDWWYDDVWSRVDKELSDGIPD